MYLNLDSRISLFLLSILAIVNLIDAMFSWTTNYKPENVATAKWQIGITDAQFIAFKIKLVRTILRSRLWFENRPFFNSKFRALLRVSNYH